MNWRDLCASSTPLDHHPSQATSGNFEDFENSGEGSFVPARKSGRGFEDFGDFGLKTTLNTLSSSKKETPGEVVGGEPSSSPHPSHSSISGEQSSKSPKFLQPGWLVVYRDHNGRLGGGAGERDAGTVATCDERSVTLANGDHLSLNRIIAVAQTNQAGAIVAAWLVARHGLDGTRENDQAGVSS